MKLKAKQISIQEVNVTVPDVSDCDAPDVDVQW